MCETLVTSADVLTVSNVELQARYGGTIVPHARNEARFDPSNYDRDRIRTRLGFADTDLVLLCMGVFQDRKAQLALVHAFAQFVHRHPEARLVLVGNHPSDYAFAVGKADLPTFEHQRFERK